MSKCQLIQQADGRWKCPVCGRFYDRECRSDCLGEVQRMKRCMDCPHGRRESLVSVSCGLLDAEVDCCKERVHRHTRRLLDVEWKCERWD